jgi:hypothetical protein
MAQVESYKMVKKWLCLMPLLWKFTK